MSSTGHILALPPGYVLESYRIERVLGEGGFGITYLALEMESEKQVAIKEMLPDGIATRVAGSAVVPKGDHLRESFEWALESFGKEAKALAKLSHPNIVPIHRLFRANGTAYMVMDFVEGESFKHWLTAHPQPAEEELRGILLPLLDGLESVHEKGLLHRDIKPDNIFITSKGRPVLLDFGAARVDTGRTQTMTAVVSEGYSPFEQYQRKARQTPATDLYSLAAVMVRAITGETPATAIDRSADETLQKPLSQTHAGRCSAEFLRAVDAGFAVNAPDRPQSVAQWREMLLGRAGETAGRSASQTPSSKPTPSPVRSAAVSVRPDAASEQHQAPTRPKMTALPVLAVLAGIAILAAGAWWFGMEKPKRDRADSLVDEARAAFVKDDRATAQSKLDEVLAVLPSHTGAEELRAEMASTLLEAIERALGSADSALARKDMLAAREAYAQVLALRPDHPRASSGLAGLKDIVGGLEVKTSPAGAKVQFGGLDSGTSPCTLKALPLGRHRLTLTLEGYDPVTEDVALRNEAFVSMDQQLARQRGTIKIESAPPGMIFNLRMTKSVIGSADETKRVETGKTPMSLENLPTGDYEARIFRQGWPDAVQVVSLSPQSTQNVSHAFAEGSLAVESMPPGMKATLLKPDGSVFTEGRTPLAMSVPTGSGYIVKMTRPGWPDFETKALTINKTANPPVSHAFNEGILEVTSEPPGMTAQITNTEGVNVISGKTPLRSLALPSGKEYLVKVQREGWPDFTANVRSPEVKPLVTHVAFDSGDLAVESNLKGAVISLTPEGTRIAELSSEITLAEWRLSAPLLSPEVRTPLEQALSSLRSNLAAAESSSPVKPFRSLAPAILKDIPTGTYVCVVRRPGSPVWQDKITITKGSNTLKLDFLTVTARTEVDACMMFHEGQRLGRDGCFTPLDFPALPGSYRVTVRFPGLAEMEQELVVAKESGQSHLVDYPGATLTLTSEPTGAIVMHRGNNIGKTPLTFPAVSAGEFEYALQLAGYMQRDIKLQLKPKEKHQEKTVFSNKPEDNVPAEFLEKMRAPNGLDLLVPKDGKKLPGQINLKLDGEAVTVSFDLDHSWTNPNNIDYEDAGSGSATTTLAEISRRWRHIELSLGTYGHPTFLLEDVKVPLNGSVKRTMDAGQGRYLIGYGSRYKTFKTSDVVFEFSNSIIIRADLDHLPIVLGAFD